MSQDTAPEPAPDNTPPTELPEAAAEKAKRERATYPIRLMPMLGETLAEGVGAPVEGVSFSTIPEAGRWVLASGKPGQKYAMSRFVGWARRPNVALEEGAL